MVLPPRVVGRHPVSSFSDSARIATCPDAGIAGPSAVSGVAWGKLTHFLLKQHQILHHSHAHLTQNFLQFSGFGIAGPTKRDASAG